MSDKTHLVRFCSFPDYLLKLDEEAVYLKIIFKVEKIIHMAMMFTTLFDLFFI